MPSGFRFPVAPVRIEAEILVFLIACANVATLLLTRSRRVRRRSAKALLREVAHLPVGGIRERLAAELRGWIQNAGQFDDRTFVVMKAM